MRLPRQHSESASRRSIRSPWAAGSLVNLRAGRWFLLLAVLSFALPTGALPLAGAAALPTHPAAPAAPALSAPAGGPVAVAHLAPQVIPGSKGPAGPAIAQSRLPGLSLVAPGPGSATGVAAAGLPAPTGSTSSKARTSGLAGVETPRQIGFQGILQRLKNQTKNETAMDALPSTYQVPIGYFTGFINDSVDRLGITPIAVQVYSSALCSTNRCPAAQTTSNGSFTIACAAPGGPGDNDAIVLTTNNWYFDNVSYDTCVANVTTWVGTIFLVRDGVGIGFVKDPTTGKPIAGVTVQAITRDNTFLGYPSATTSANGSFMIGLPPVPSKVTFSPPPGYEGTFNYTDVLPGTGNRPDVPPWLGGDNMGTFYLVRQTLVKVHILDASTNTSISGDPAAMVACDAFGGGCLTQGPGVTSDYLYTFANPGWNYFEVYANGYIESSTDAQLIPQEAPGTIFSIGSVYLQPEGSFTVKVGLFDPLGGVLPSWGSPGGTGIYGTVCSDDGYQFSQEILSGTIFNPGAFNMTSDTCGSTPQCFGVGANKVIGGAPLRNFVQIIPDTTGFCSPFGPLWPVNGYDPVWENYTYVNLTAGHQLPGVIDVNFTIGDYIAGKVYVQNTTSAPPNFDVTESSTDNQYWNTESYSWNTARPTDFGPCTATGVGSSATSFCIAVPPGNSQITVTAPGYDSNWTWVHTSNYCCKAATGTPGWPAPLSLATENHVQSINLTLAEGLVWGYTVIADTGAQPVPLTSVSVCPASALSTAPCGSGLGINGTYYGVPAPIGPDLVTISSPGYSPDSAWVNVTAGGNTSVGTIPLYPLGVLTGQVDGPGGVPLFVADVRYCTVLQAGSCYTGGGTNLGPGTTSSSGTFNGTVEGGWLPWASYVVTVTAPGYTTDWSYGNVTVGNYTTLPTFTLQPIGTNTTPERPVPGQPHGAASSSGSGTAAAGVWVTGRFFSNASGGVFIGPGSGGAGFCPLNGFVCSPIPDGTNTEGYFNTSLSPGLYFLNVSASGYQAISVFVNASNAGFLDLGILYLSADYWVSGQVAINPWISLTTDNGTGRGLGPAVSVEGCALGRSDCVSGIPAATNGTYNTPIPPGTSATIVAAPSGPGYGGSVPGGFDDNVTDVRNISSSNTTLGGTNAILPIDIFGIVSGRIWDNNTVNLSANLTWPAFGLAFASFTVLELGNTTGSIGYTADGGGDWVAIVPGNNGANKTHVLTFDSPAYTEYSYIVKDPIVNGYQPADGGNATLERFGWIQTEFLSTGTNLPVPDVAANAQFTDLKTGNSYSDHSEANAAGFLNLSAPYGHDILVQVSAPDFNSTNFTVAYINTSATTFANSTTPGVYGSYHIPAYGWVLSQEVNFSDGAPPPLTEYPQPAITDPVNGLGIPGAQVTVNSPDPDVLGGASQSSNWDGQFYSDAPIGPQDAFQITRPGYLTNDTNIVVKTASYRILQTVNLTGEAIAAGLVLSYPANVPVAGATVQVCGAVKNQQVCSTAITNLSGVYWSVGPPGPLTITVTQVGFVTGATQVEACSDCWVWAGTTTLSEFGTVSGNVRGLPSGFDVEGANVSLCSTLGTPTGPCGPSEQTNMYGHFVISAPPGEYILAVNDTDYNSTFLPVALSPGELTTVGTLFLSEFGTDEGTIYDEATYTPLVGAEVEACAVFSEGTCAPAQVTNAHGGYKFSAAPGEYEVTVSAANYVTNVTDVTVVAGITTEVSVIALQSIGSNAVLTVTGTVIDSTTSAPLNGATVTALFNGTVVSSNPSVYNGSFTLQVEYGTYDLLATYPGYATWYRNNTPVHEDLGGLTIVLSPMTYAVRGQVTDALTHQLLGGARIYTAVATSPTAYSPGSWLATADASGEYSLSLTNGTHALYLEPANGSAIAYAPVEFAVAINGAPRTVDLQMTPQLSSILGRVIDASTGIGLANAIVQVVGQVDGIKYAQTFTTGADGSFSARVYVGEYTASTSYGAYQSVQKSFTVAGSQTSVTLSMSPLPTPVTAATSSVPVWAIWGAVGFAVVAVGAAIYLAGRPMRRDVGPSGSNSPK